MSEDVEKVLSILFTTGQKAVIEASVTHLQINWLCDFEETSGDCLQEVKILYTLKKLLKIVYKMSKGYKMLINLLWLVYW